jgi:cytochrome c
MSVIGTCRRGGHPLQCGLLVGLLAVLLAGCMPAEDLPLITGANGDRGRLLLEQYDCGSCHLIPGVRRAEGDLGPPLAAFARRVYIAGELPNQHELLMQWIRHPSSLVPDTLMPDQAIPDSQARDMSAYLMSLR